jgi:hypothetical protein
VGLVIELSLIHDSRHTTTLAIPLSQSCGFNTDLAYEISAVQRAKTGKLDLKIKKGQIVQQCLS